MATVHPFYWQAKEMRFGPTASIPWPVSHSKPDMPGHDKFPINNVNTSTFDAAVHPLGGLSHKGAAQCKARGSMMSHAHAADGVTFAPGSTRLRASNYRRTQLSAQHFAAGLLSIENTSGKVRSTGQSVPQVEVGNSNECGIAAFESSNGLLKAAKALMSTDLFLERERLLKPISTLLSNCFPYFRLHAQLHKSSAGVVHRVAIGDDGTPGSRWMWIRAADIFTTYRAHGLSLDAFGQAHEFETLTHEHLLWRFQTLFTHADIMHLAVGRLLKDLQGELQAHKARAYPPHSATPFQLFSGHDVTLMPLLYALCMHGPAHGGVQVTLDSGRQFVSSSAAALVRAIGWPRYASCVSFELHVPTSPSLSKGHGGDGHWREGVFVRWVWDNDDLGGVAHTANSAAHVEHDERGDHYVHWATRKVSGDTTPLHVPSRARRMVGEMTLQDFDRIVAAANRHGLE